MDFTGIISPAQTSVCVPGPNDVLFCNDERRRERHRGNVRFREWIEAEKDSFPVEACVGQGLVIQRRKQERVAKDLVQRWRCQSPPGGFLYQSKDNQSVKWIDIGNERAIEVMLIALKEAAMERHLTSSSAQNAPTMPTHHDVNLALISANVNAAFLRSVAAAPTIAATTASKAAPSSSRVVITSNDVLLDEGGKHRGHSGNLKYRMWIGLHSVMFAKFDGEPLRQRQIAAGIVRKLREQKPVEGRFLYYHERRHQWVDIGDNNAIFMTLNALRDGAASGNEIHDLPTSTGTDEANVATTTISHLTLEKGRISEVICLDEESDTDHKSTEEEGLSSQDEGSSSPSSRIECLEVTFPGVGSVTKLDLPETTKDGPFSSLSDIVLLSPSAVHVQRLPIKRKHEDMSE